MSLVGSKGIVVFAVAGALLAGCGVEGRSPVLADGALSSAEGVSTVESQLGEPLQITVFEDPLGLGGRESEATSRGFATAIAYQNYFGHPAPSHVNFAAGDVVVF